jgi:serine/threonine protein kinase
MVSALNRFQFGMRLDIENIWRQLKYGVIAMIGSGVVNRDIKIDNIMVARDRDSHFRIAFVDFADSTTKEKIKEFKEFKNVGTVIYMSPELLHRYIHKITTPGTWREYVANDLWALGMVLYVLIYKKTPKNMFDTQHPTLHSVSKDPITFYAELLKFPSLHAELFQPQAGVPPEIIADAKALLSIDPDKRISWLRKSVQSIKSKKRSASRRQQQQKSTASKRSKSQAAQALLLMASAGKQQQKK